MPATTQCRTGRNLVWTLFLGAALGVAGWAADAPIGNFMDDTTPEAFIDTKIDTRGPRTKPLPAFARPWTHVSQTSAVIYWHMNKLEKEANSYVEYGETTKYGNKTPSTTVPRYAHLHRITGLKANATYHYRKVMIENGKEVKSKDATFTTKTVEKAVHLPGPNQTYPITLDKPNTKYVLTKDISSPGTAVVIAAPNITLDLDGHTVTFAEESTKQVHGIKISAKGPAVVCNGFVKQGKAGGDYSSCIESSYREMPTEVFGIFTDMKNKNGNPVRFKGRTANIHVHHNHIMSHVTWLTNRHWPGNKLLWLNPKGDNISVHDNLLTEGCHLAIACAGTGKNIKIYNNDIKHHQQYVNGYAIQCGTPGMRVFHNRVTSIGRSVHFVNSDLEVHDNWLNTKGHMTLCTKKGPERAKKLMVELHGIKLEGGGVKNGKIHHNYMKIEQPKPDAKWSWVPCTPLNIGCGAEGMNEIYKNTFVALTHYEKTRMGGYGASGQWASSIIFVGLKGKAPSGPDKYVAWIHDNTFISNHWFITSKGNSKNAIESNAKTAMPFRARIEKNKFIMTDKPVKANGRRAFHRISKTLIGQIMNGGNTSEGMPLTGPTVDDRIKDAQKRYDQINRELKRAKVTLENLKKEELRKAGPKQTAEVRKK